MTNKLQQMDFFWELLGEKLDNITWKEALETLNIPFEFKSLGFPILVDGKKLIDFMTQRDRLEVINRDTLSSNIRATTLSGRSIETIFVPFCLNEDEIEEVEDNDPWNNREERIRTLSQASEMEDGSIDEMWVFLSGFHDSVCFRAEVEESLGITFPPFSEWANLDVAKNRSLSK